MAKYFNSKLLVIKNTLTNTTTHLTLKQSPIRAFTPNSLHDLLCCKESSSYPSPYNRNLKSPNSNLLTTPLKQNKSIYKQHSVVVKTTTPPDLSFSSENSITPISSPNHQLFESDHDRHISPVFSQTRVSTQFTDPLLHQLSHTKDSQILIKTSKHNQAPKAFMISNDNKLYLGRGNFSYVCVKTKKNLTYVTKKIKFTSNVAFNHVCKSEMNAFHLNHQNIIKLYGMKINYDISNIPKILYIYMEFGGTFNLQNVIDDEKISFDMKDRIFMINQIAEGLNYCHSSNFIHMDVKPKNIMVYKKFELKLGDFGSSVLIPRARLLTENFIESTRNVANPVSVTWQYSAPELFMGYLPTPKVDVYSIGVIMWQLLTRVMPYFGYLKDTVIYNLVKMGMRPLISLKDDSNPENDVYIKIMKQCWSQRPSIRPNCHELINSLY
ncbi:unnamed protein product [Gordionus sp. m RMFG-2023]|uniref:serine/threonine-protein kinase mos-like n=1 Tax=Gordionus sp. m RMFG-2023 TaxID=3053472 RepID=UPI0030DE1A21